MATIKIEIPDSRIADVANAFDKVHSTGATIEGVRRYLLDKLRRVLFDLRVTPYRCDEPDLRDGTWGDLGLGGENCPTCGEEAALFVDGDCGYCNPPIGEEPD